MSGIIAAQAVHIPAEWGGRGADENIPRRCGAGREARDWAGVKLQSILHAAFDVSANIVRIIRFYLGRVMGAAREHLVAETRGKALVQAFDR